MTAPGSPPPPPDRPRRGWRDRLGRPSRVRLVVWLLLALVGFGITVSVRANSGDAGLAGARQEDLVRILDDLDAKGQRLQGEVDDLQAARDRLNEGGAGSSAAALADAKARADGLAILAGTVGAQGPGIVLVVDDPQHRVGADIMVDAIQELRDAGAETMQIGSGDLPPEPTTAPAPPAGSVRVIGSTSVVDDPAGGLTVDGHHLDPPYRIDVIGDAHTLAQAMQIPGGVLDTVATRSGAAATVRTPGQVTVTATRPLPTPAATRPTH